MLNMQGLKVCVCVYIDNRVNECVSETEQVSV